MMVGVGEMAAVVVDEPIGPGDREREQCEREQNGYDKREHSASVRPARARA